MTDSTDLKITTRSQMAYIQKRFSKLTWFLEFDEVVNWFQKKIYPANRLERKNSWLELISVLIYSKSHCLPLHLKIQMINLKYLSLLEHLYQLFSLFHYLTYHVICCWLSHHTVVCNQAFHKTCNSKIKDSQMRH